MTPNPKHLKILSEVTGLYEVECTSEFQRINVLAALQAMQILQLRINELENGLEKYGNHLAGCYTLFEITPDHDGTCTCGFEKLSEPPQP